VEPRKGNKKLSLKTVLIMWAEICGIIASNVYKMTSKKNNLLNLDIKGVNFCVTQFATQFTHVFRQY
jgi:hypothetical protein